ncbi:MAG: hypothetical protein JWP34_4738 [Massilia sp.]|nr:hypothetical protein [Massilia sp.]
MSIRRDGMNVFVYDQKGELVAQVYAPDDNAAGIAFQNQHALTLDRAINPQDYPPAAAAAPLTPTQSCKALQQCDEAITDGNPPAAFAALAAYYAARVAGIEEPFIAGKGAGDVVAAQCAARFAADLDAICTERSAS